MGDRFSRPAGTLARLSISDPLLEEAHITDKLKTLVDHQRQLHDLELLQF